MSIGRNTERGRDLEARAERIIGLEKVHTDLKIQAKRVKEQIDAAYKDADGNGYDKRVLRQVIKELQLDDRQAVFEFESEVTTYRHALGIEDDGTAAPGSFAAKIERGETSVDEMVSNVVRITKDAASRIADNMRAFETEAAE